MRLLLTILRVKPKLSAWTPVAKPRDGKTPFELPQPVEGATAYAQDPDPKS